MYVCICVYVYVYVYVHVYDTHICTWCRYDVDAYVYVRVYAYQIPLYMHVDVHIHSVPFTTSAPQSLPLYAGGADRACVWTQGSRSNSSVLALGLGFLLVALGSAALQGMLQSRGLAAGPNKSAPSACGHFRAARQASGFCCLDANIYMYT